MSKEDPNDGRAYSINEIRQRAIQRRIQAESTYAGGGFDPMPREHAKAMFEFLANRMTPELRGELMRTLPQAYNHYCGRTVVVVVPANDAELHGITTDPVGTTD